MSHLLMRIAQALLASSIRPAMRMSCLVGPCSASITRRTTSASSMAFSLRNSENVSTLVFDICVCRFMPAVSTSTYLLADAPSPIVNGTSTESLVVPAMSLTITRSAFRRRLM